MSADNGIYMLRTLKWPTKVDNVYLNHAEGMYEWRVAYCHCIENLDHSDLYMPIYFGDSAIYSSIQEAWDQAKSLEAKYEWTEYGICRIEKEVHFPNITKAACEQALDCFVGALPVRADSEILVEIEVLGGVAEVVNDGGVSVSIKDHDNEGYYSSLDEFLEDLHKEA